jgi:hypothetical protein
MDRRGLGREKHLKYWEEIARRNQKLFAGIESCIREIRHGGEEGYCTSWGAVLA